LASLQITENEFLDPIQDILPRVEELMMVQVSNQHLELDAALRRLILSGGKRVRPIVALLTGRMLGCDDDRLITLAAAVELLHTATLVHDDLIDDAMVRRGIATINSKWTSAATVLTGDYIFARAAKLAAETNSVEVLKIFADTLATIVSGELTQQFSGRGDLSRGNYDKRIYAKTASMFVLATTASAILSEVDSSIIGKMKKYGFSIGMAFQIIDDVLDFTSEQTIIGKPVASDLRQGLITLPTIYFVEKNPLEKNSVQAISDNYYNEEAISKIVLSIRASGAIEYSLNEASKYIDEGVKTLEDLPENSEKLALRNLAYYFIQRTI